MARKRWTELTDAERSEFWRKVKKSGTAMDPRVIWENQRQDELLAEKVGDDAEALADLLAEYALKHPGRSSRRD